MALTESRVTVPNSFDKPNTIEIWSKQNLYKPELLKFQSTFSEFEQYLHF